MLVIASTPANNTLEILLIFGNKKDLELQSYITIEKNWISSLCYTRCQSLITEMIKNLKLKNALPFIIEK